MSSEKIYCRFIRSAKKINRQRGCTNRKDLPSEKNHRAFHQRKFTIREYLPPKKICCLRIFIVLSVKKIYYSRNLLCFQQRKFTIQESLLLGKVLPAEKIYYAFSRGSLPSGNICPSRKYTTQENLLSIYSPSKESLSSGKVYRGEDLSRRKLLSIYSFSRGRLAEEKVLQLVVLGNAWREEVPTDKFLARESFQVVYFWLVISSGKNIL